MPKFILVFSDGTGQIGGLRPDQRLSNVYKLYRACRPGPGSPIPYTEQTAFYDPGLGAGETGGWTLKRVRNLLAAAVGNGIDENIIDCYEAIIARYEIGDRICLFGFSRGAYTARCVANVLQLCGVPTKMPDGSLIPTKGPRLRKVAEDAVRYVYNHGAGKDRQGFFPEREEKARRFRHKYSCDWVDPYGEAQGNVQPEFVGAFDTVAALGSRLMQWLMAAALLVLGTLTVAAAAFVWPWWVAGPLVLVSLAVLRWLWVTVHAQLKYFRAVPDGPITSWHFASWNLRHYDHFLGRHVRYARHALAIDENRRAFPRVEWAHVRELDLNRTADPPWLRQVWFAGNHSDIGGSYPEDESRLSDIALDWMVGELRTLMPEVRIRDDLLVMAPHAFGLQHDEVRAVQDMMPRFIPGWLRRRMTWRRALRDVPTRADLHPTVLSRLRGQVAPHLDEIRRYRPENLRHHAQAERFFNEDPP